MLELSGRSSCPFLACREIELRNGDGLGWGDQAGPPVVVVVAQWSRSRPETRTEFSVFQEGRGGTSRVLQRNAVDFFFL